MIFEIFDFRFIKQVRKQSLMCKIPIQNLEDIIDGFVDMQIMLDNGYHTVGSNSRINLNPDSILICTPEFLDSKMLFKPLEEIMRSFS